MVLLWVLEPGNEGDLPAGIRSQGAKIQQLWHQSYHCCSSSRQKTLVNSARARPPPLLLLHWYTRRLKLQLDRLHRWRGWEADAETVIELCGEEEGGDEDTVAMLDEAMEVRQEILA